METFQHECSNQAGSEAIQAAAKAIADETGKQPCVRVGAAMGELSTPLLRRLYRHWRDLCADGLPSYRAIDPLDFKFALGHVMLVEPADDGADFRYRIGGTVVAQHYGIEMTGKRVSECYLPVSSAFYLATYREVMERPRPLYTFHIPPRRVPVIHWERLLLPFADEAGRVVRILTGVVSGGPRAPESETG